MGGKSVLLSECGNWQPGSLAEHGTGAGGELLLASLRRRVGGLDAGSNIFQTVEMEDD